MNTDQQQYADSLSDNTPAGIAITLADALGYLIWEREFIEEYAHQRKPYADFKIYEHELWEESYNADPETAGKFEEIKTTEAEFNRICEETWAADAMPGELIHADIGIRPLLALAVKKCTTDKEAEAIVNLFYDTFNESASK